MGASSAGVILSGLQQLNAYHTDVGNEGKQADLQSKLQASLLHEEHIKTQLDSMQAMMAALDGQIPTLKR